MEFKVDDTRSKMFTEDFWKNLKNGENLFKAMTSKATLEFYRKFCESIPKEMLSYYKEYHKAFARFLEINKPDAGTIPDSPDVFPANGHDIFNYVARYGKGNFHCQAILKFNGKLNFERLSKAVRLSVEKEPVLGCRFIEGNPPYWKRLENIEQVKFCSFEQMNSSREAIQKFIESPLDMDADPKIKVKLMRSNTYDILGVKANHACLDGTGIKEYILLLANIYSDLSNSDEVFIAVPSTRGRTDQDRLFEALSITNPDDLWIPGSDITIPTWAFPWQQGTSNIFRIITDRLLPEHLDRMSSYAKAKGATINDIILTAYYRAMLKMGQPVYGVPMGIAVTVDLRRYLRNHKTEAIRNFSGSVNAWLSMVENESFSHTLTRVTYMMNEIKNGYPGLQSAIGLERLEKISFRDTLAYYHATTNAGKKPEQPAVFYGNRCVPSLSNLGIISKTLIKFDDITAVDYYIIPPVVSPPGVLLEVGTYNRVMTMALGFIENTVLSEDMQRLMDNIKAELLGACS